MARSLLLRAANDFSKLDPKDEMTNYVYMIIAGVWAKIDPAVARMYTQNIFAYYAIEYAAELRKTIQTTPNWFLVSG